MEWPEARYWFGDTRTAIRRFDGERDRKVLVEIPDRNVEAVSAQSRALVIESGAVWPGDVLEYARANIETFVTRPMLSVAFAWTCARRCVEARTSRSSTLRAASQQALAILGTIAATLDSKQRGLSERLGEAILAMSRKRPFHSSEARALGTELDDVDGFREVFYAAQQALRVGEGEYALACARLSVSAVASLGFLSLEPAELPTPRQIASEACTPAVQHELFLVASTIEWLASRPTPPLCERFADDHMGPLVSALGELAESDEAKLAETARAFETERRRHLYGIVVGEPTHVAVTEQVRDDATIGNPPNQRVAAAWKRLDDSLRRWPVVQASLRPPADEDALEELESAIGESLPDEVAASLLIHDGESSCTWVCGGALLSAERIEDLWDIYESLGEEEGVRPDARFVAGGGWSREMLPVTDLDGSGYFVHLETGEVWYHEHARGFTTKPVAPSWTTLLEHIAAALENDRIAEDSWGGLSLFPKIRHCFS